MDYKRAQPEGKARVPRLDRRNAMKYVHSEPASGEPWSASDDDASGEPWSASDDAPGVYIARFPPAYSAQTSFRIGGGDGEVDLICRNLGLSGPEDFAIPASTWEARKSRSSSDLLPPSRLLRSDPIAAGDSIPSTSPTLSTAAEDDRSLPDKFRVGIHVREDEAEENLQHCYGGSGGRDGGIRGIRPPAIVPPPPVISVLAPQPSRLTLAPPPSMSFPPVDEAGSAWDIVRSFAPEEDGRMGAEAGRGSFDSEEDEWELDEAIEGDETMGETTGYLTRSTLNNVSDVSSTVDDAMIAISTKVKFKRNIRAWIRGERLGSGSFGTVYEAISDVGFFFAVKEVSLLDQGSNAKQCIFQLEQEIALLSRFEHENIVQYFGTDKEEAKLYIFLELVTQGSLASLYQKYHLKDSQVSAYTRQILNGLNYLHNRNVVHRDIKCANILVDAKGSVKLADFGLAKEATKLNGLKSSKGSVYWMAPETQAFFRIGRGEPPPIPGSLSKEARDFIHQCVQQNPDDRPSAAQLLKHPFVSRLLPASASSGQPSEIIGRGS
ncbi:mitogen-activated protein kinase kinase kinase 9-like isoform X3 [Phoenix dactylifera]|uniref:mitogen-activated protein kinase kinase kinase n=1 Tax=Phoenix dactylifera TaxID=42345 RepID=A0A8B8ZNG4_PHODC|nr:mitogen-activated protein kinase kinase kinase 9-like isoform X3 [Phoenix dactylifera]